MDDDQLRRRAWEGIAAFQRIIGGHGPDSHLAETPSYVASAVPEIPSSLINAAVPRDGAALAPHLDEIEDFYADSPKWGAWLDPAATEDAGRLQARGLVLDSRPVLMAAALDDIAGLGDAPPADEVTMAEVGFVNDLAYGYEHLVIARAVSAFPADVLYARGVSVGAEVASVAMVVDAGEDAFVTMVATLPHRRGNRLASNLLRAALGEARQRGQTTTSLQASKLGQGIYARLGYRPLGEVHLYEKCPRVSLNPALEDARFCPRCGQQADVDYPRSINCSHCGYGAYYNPKPVAAAIPVTPDDRIILLRRGFDPGKDLWTFPGGFVDLGESVEQAAHREAQEELEIDIELTRLVGVYSRPEDRVVLIVFAATTDQTPQTTPEALEVRAFAPDEIPWQELAFWSTTNALRDVLERS